MEGGRGRMKGENIKAMVGGAYCTRSWCISCLSLSHSDFASWCWRIAWASAF